MPSHKPLNSQSKKIKKAHKAHVPLSPIKAGKKAAAAVSKAIVYSMIADGTLTKAQIRDKGFQPGVISRVLARKAIAKGSFRVASNPTQHGFSSGYHEASVVTDAVDKFSQRKVSNGLATMPAMTGSFWSKYSGHSFPEKNLQGVLESGDGARTDTARTILSGPNGAVGGHSGSGVHTGGQADAHDLLREQMMRTVSDPKMTPRVATAIAAATVVASMAPGKLASRAKNADKLKDSAAKATWEDDRHEAKERLAVVESQLTPQEHALARGHMNRFMQDLGGGRKLAPKRLSSPVRQRRAPTKAEPISGGEYAPGKELTGKPKVGLGPNPSHREVTQYVSEPFRVRRQ